MQLVGDCDVHRQKYWGNECIEPQSRPISQVERWEERMKKKKKKSQHTRNEQRVQLSSRLQWRRRRTRRSQRSSALLDNGVVGDQRLHQRSATAASGGRSAVLVTPGQVPNDSEHSELQGWRGRRVRGAGACC